MIYGVGTDLTVTGAQAEPGEGGRGQQFQFDEDAGSTDDDGTTSLAQSQLMTEMFRSTLDASVLETVRERGYGDFEDFRRGFEKYLSLAEERVDGLAGCSTRVDAWRRAAKILGEPIWHRFLFDPSKDLAAYVP